MAYLNGEKVNNAKFTNEETIAQYVAAGVNPKDKKTPLRGCSEDNSFYPANIKLLSINDEQTAVNSITWSNLPDGLDGNLIERILYYRGQGMFFYLETLDKFMFLPFALGSKGIDVYGRFQNVTPLPFNGAVATEKESPWVKGLEYDVMYDILLDDPSEEIFKKCVLLSDISKQISQTNISRKILNDPLIHFEATLLPYAKTNLLNGTGVSAMRTQSEDEASNVRAASKSIDAAAKRGEKYVAVVGQIDFQDLTGGSLANVEQYLMAMQSVDNYRLQTHGVDSGGIFQKQAHMLESESALNQSKSSFSMADRIYQRQRFCDIVNSMFGLGISVEASETALDVDMDMDGDTYEDGEFEEEENDGNV